MHWSPLTNFEDNTMNCPIISASYCIHPASPSSLRSVEYFYPQSLVWFSSKYERRSLSIFKNVFTWICCENRSASKIKLKLSRFSKNKDSRTFLMLIFCPYYHVYLVSIHHGCMEKEECSIGDNMIDELLLFFESHHIIFHWVFLRVLAWYRFLQFLHYCLLWSKQRHKLQESGIFLSIPVWTLICMNHKFEIWRRKLACCNFLKTKKCS